ncbi:ASKHA domain-containing protein [Chloroflexota bacterium]
MWQKKESAAVIGLFPDCAGENISAVGNAAGDGARMALLNVDKRAEARLFSQNMWFPHMKESFPGLHRFPPQV